MLLQLQQVSILQFKNYPKISFSFTERIVGICGNNGIGKTNLLDAIYYLCFTRSYFSKADIAHVLHGAQGFRISGQFKTDPSTLIEAICILRETGKKEFLLEGEAYEKFSHHIGKFPCVFIAPDDVLIITGASDERRHYLDTLLCQLDIKYLQQLVGYNKVLQQRNSYLKSVVEKTLVDKSLLEVYDQQLCIHGQYIFEQRNMFLQQLIPSIQLFYTRIAGSNEGIDIKYESALQHQPFDILLKQNRDKDLLLQRTTQGIHRDDLDILLNEQAFKSTASQGQRKSLLFALKLAEFEILKENKGFPPILLLDDVFEKLDEQRMQNLLNWVCVQNTGQIFITDTHCERLQQGLKEMGLKFQLILLR